MKPLSLDIINASAPYEVYWHEKSRTYRFKSDFGVVLAIGFDDDDIIENAESYVFSIINVNKIPSPRDLKMRDTVMLIIENFFNINEAALLYICESGDGGEANWVKVDPNEKFSVNSLGCITRKSSSNYRLVQFLHR